AGRGGRREGARRGRRGGSRPRAASGLPQDKVGRFRQAADPGVPREPRLRRPVAGRVDQDGWTARRAGCLEVGELVANENGPRQVDAQLVARAQQQTWGRLSTGAAVDGRMRAEEEGLAPSPRLRDDRTQPAMDLVELLPGGEHAAYGR